MVRKFLAPSLLSLALLAGGSAYAEDINGVWLRDTGISKVRFAPCGAAVCGTISWLKEGADPNAKVGEKVFFDMKPDGPDSWAGSAFNPEDGKTYTGKMTLSGGTLTTKGCVLGGLICKSITWTRSN
ncbi:DUF2147 domain-containing protein [Methylovirgula sp. 4M-Z18]|uniref:DUF2147 domain-containing protein n=1 Tax=Methylovirgula sp. 4M-Z18 TaxID=2293567 RepID=UPI000E2FB4FA|nr:DUF2147 domain-containing protein [Methylovirgula sp. 4M-Z18]RFB79695.1 DUF2147 domain-containing protein [Methylovirgula sp. 4M-Z18]